MKNVLIIAFIIFLAGNGLFIKSLYEDHRHMQTIATLEQVEYDLEGISFFQINKHYFDGFLFILVLFVAAIVAVYKIEYAETTKAEEARLQRIVNRCLKVDKKLFRLSQKKRGLWNEKLNQGLLQEKKILWDEYERAKAQLKEAQESLSHGEQSPA